MRGNSYFKTVAEYLDWEKIHLESESMKSYNRKKYKITEAEIKSCKEKIRDNIIEIKQYEVKKIKNEKFTLEETRDNIELFKLLYDTDASAFVRWRNRSTKEYYSYPVKSLLQEHKLYRILNSEKWSSKEDLMYSLNVFKTMKSASEENIFSIHAIAIDLDFKEVERLKEKKPIEIINLLEKNAFDKIIPIPNFIEYGNNIRLIYNLDRCYGTRPTKNLAKKLAKIIAERLDDWGGHYQPLTSYGRVIHSVNSKTKDEVKVMYLDRKQYYLKDLQDKWLEPLDKWNPEWKCKSTRKKAKVINLNSNTASFEQQAKMIRYNKNRIDDLFKIQRYFECDCKGFREFLCFQVRNHAILAGMPSEDATQVLRQFVDRFKKPMYWNRIEGDTRNVERHQYTYKSETILKYVGIDEEEERLLGLKAILSETEYKYRENIRVKTIQKAKYRDIEGLTKTEVKRRNLFITIARAELAKVSLKAITKELGIDLSNTSKKMKKKFDKINYLEIKQEIEKGMYVDIKASI